MSEAKHTPGPWEARGVGVWAKAPADQIGIVANTRTANDNGQDEANAHLIAAAPETASELADVAAFITDAADDETLGALVRSHEKGIRTAIAKAKGE